MARESGGRQGDEGQVGLGEVAGGGLGGEELRGEVAGAVG